MAKWEEYKDDFWALCESGFIAVNQMDEHAAKKLFAAAEVLDKNNTMPQTGYGYMHLCKLELKQAAKVFEEILKKEPNNEMVKAFLGVVLSLSPQEGAKGEKILEESARKVDEPTIKTLAIDTLDFVEKFIKKAPSPAAVQKPKR